MCAFVSSFGMSSSFELRMYVFLLFSLPHAKLHCNNFDVADVCFIQCQNKWNERNEGSKEKQAKVIKKFVVVFIGLMGCHTAKNRQKIQISCYFFSHVYI